MCASPPGPRRFRAVPSHSPRGCAQMTRGLYRPETARADPHEVPCRSSRPSRGPAGTVRGSCEGPVTRCPKRWAGPHPLLQALQGQRGPAHKSRGPAQVPSERVPSIGAPPGPRKRGSPGLFRYPEKSATFDYTPTQPWPPDLGCRRGEGPSIQLLGGDGPRRRRRLSDILSGTRPCRAANASRRRQSSSCPPWRG